MYKKQIILYDKWVSYINIKKHYILDKIDNTLLIDTSPEYKKFITVLNNIFNLNIFNITKISYKIITTLYIYINTHLNKILNNGNNGDNGDNGDNGNDDDDENIIIILKLIIHLIINIEFILNTQFFLIIYILNKNTTLVTHTSSDTTNIKVNKPKLLIQLENICSDINVNIKSSTIILLLLKINSQLCNYNIVEIIKNNLIINEVECSKTINIFNNEINKLLDNFIVEISNIIDTPEDNKLAKKYILCVNYILKLSDLLYNIFNTLFDIFIKYVIKKYPIHKDTKYNVSKLLENNILLLKKKLLAI